MRRIEEIQVEAYREDMPQRSLSELEQVLKSGKDLSAVRDLMVYAAKYADMYGYTMSEIWEG